jgi:hypothetical protein
MQKDERPENVNRPSRAMEEIASWRLATELLRRFPNRLKILEMHPGGGQYDCLKLMDLDEGVKIYINRGGSVAIVLEREDREIRPWGMAWPQALVMAEDMKECLNEICQALGWSVPDPLPPSTRQAVVYRFMAEFVAHTCLSRRDWEWRNGFCDTSGYGGGVRREWFRQFPKAQESARRHDEDDITRIPEYRFWFLVRTNKIDTPVLCLETNGIAFRPNGQSEDLYKLFQQHHRIWPLIVHVIPELLP